MIEAPTFQDAWLTILKQLREEGERIAGVTDERSIGSFFGARPREYIELLGLRVHVRNPRARLFRTDVYSPDLAFGIAQTLWMFGGSNDLAPIEFYNPRGREFSDDGRTLFGAPGARIFKSTAGDQFAAAIHQLSKDPSSRRAVIQFFLPEDSIKRPRDASCIGSVQLVIRRDRLNAIVTMRSQAAARVFAYDSFLLSMLHEAAAKELEIDLGTYIAFSGSAHYYADECELVDAILKRATLSVPPSMPPMESKMSRILPHLLRAESELRSLLTDDVRASVDLNNFELDAYWRDLLRLLVVEIRMRRGGIRYEGEVAELPHVYREMTSPRAKARLS